MLNLMLHCGSQSVERTEVESSATPPSTSTWKPIAHSRLLDLVEDTLTGSGLSIVNQAHALTRDHGRYFGLLEVRSGSHGHDYELVVGLRNSHDKSFPAAIALGAQVLVCDNLCFFGEVTLARRHTRFIERDLPQIVSRAVASLTDLRSQHDQRVSAYKTTEIDDRAAHDLIIRCVDARVMPVTKIPDVLTEWRTPRHVEFCSGHNAWRLHNAVTEAIKGRSLAELPRRSHALHGILDGVCGLAV